MRRKVIRLAQKTLVVSLPAKWARRFNVRKGDEIEIDENGSTLNITPATATKCSKTTVRIGKHFLRRMVDTPYRMGYQEIRFEYDNPKIYGSIESEVNQLMGFEIVSQGKNHCVARNLAQGIETEFETSLNRLFLVTIGFLEDISNTPQLDELITAEQTTNRLAHFCKRMLNLGMTPDQKRSRSIYRIVSLLEELSDMLKKLCIHAGNISKKEMILLGKAGKQLRAAYSLFNRYDDKTLSKYGRMEKENEKEVISLLKDRPTFSAAVISSVVEYTKHITEEIYPPSRIHQSNSSVVV